MIDRREILDNASIFGLLPQIIEKDYVLGWLLAGIHAHTHLSESWIFKGGTCLKKCYFETYRFSEDLDFTLNDESQLDRSFLRNTFQEIASWVNDQSGLSIPSDQLDFDIYTNTRGRLSCQGKIAYRGPISPTSISGGWPKIKLDLTADEKLVLSPIKQEVFHPYSDRLENDFQVNCYRYEEAFGEKIRALGERTRPRDLYDVVNLYRHIDTRPNTSVLRDVLQQKCSYKGIPVPTYEELLSHRAALEQTWTHMLGHQLPNLPPLNDFWNTLPEIFTWIASESNPPQRKFIRYDAKETPIITRILPLHIPVRTRSILEIIRFAAANHLCVDLTYNNGIRRIEPYSLRQTSEGNFVLHAIRSDSEEHRSYRIDRIKKATVTSQTFIPHYTIELTSTGPLPILPAI
jgi:predicted nucleotidyltransferase component of viral defense system